MGKSNAILPQRHVGRRKNIHIGNILLSNHFIHQRITKTGSVSSKNSDTETHADVTEEYEDNILMELKEIPNVPSED